MSKKDENRFPLRLDDLTRWKVESWYKKAGCQSRNEFIEKAVNFYADYLAGQENNVLPPAIESAIDGRLGMFEDRMSKLLFKQTVEVDMGLTTVLQALNVNPDYIKALRADSVKNVKATNGRLTFERKARQWANDGSYGESGYDEDEDDEWQD